MTLIPILLTVLQVLPLHRDMNVTGVNAQTQRTELIMYSSEEEARSLPFEKSPFYLDLNGTWNFLFFNSEKDIPAELGGWGKITVPGNWEFQGHGTPVYVNTPYDFAAEAHPPVLPDDIPVGIYMRTFTVPAAWAGREVYLNLCGAKSGVYTIVNGKDVGYSEDSKDLARFDITPYLKEGENELVLKCTHWSTGSYLECQDFWRVSGIERDVYLSSESSAASLDFSMVADYDLANGDGIFSLTTTVPAEYKLIAADGEVVSEGGAGVRGVRIPAVKPWSAEEPNLYTLLLKAGGEYTRFDVGFRHTEIRGNVFYFNGQPIKFKGVNMHEHNEFTGHWCDREYLRRNLVRMRELNINSIRTCHYPQSRAFYELCDSLGFYVYDEANIESHGMGYGPESLAKDPAWYANHEDRTLNMYRRTAGYPCVTVLSLGNEAGNGVNFERTYDLLKAMEKGGQNRPVVYERAAHDRNSDFLNPMYADTRWLHKQAELPSAKPVVQCEYSHAMGNSNGSFDLMWYETYAYDNLQGGFIWDWIDQGIAVEDAKGRKYWTYGGDYGDPSKDPAHWWADRNFCCNGLVNPDLTPHPGAFEVKHFYQEAAIEFAPVENPGEQAAMNRFQIFNRFYFKSLNHILRWEITEDGVKIADGEKLFTTAPRTAEAFEAALPEMDPLKTYYINFSLLTPEASGMLPAEYPVATEQLLLRSPEKTLPEPARYKVRIRKIGDKIVLKGIGGRLVVDSSTGRVVQFRQGLKNVILKKFGLGPEFWRAPLDNDWGDGGPQSRNKLWKDAPAVLSAEAFTDEAGGAVVVTYGLPYGCTMETEYRLAKGGELRITSAFHGGKEHVDIPRIGFRTRMKAKCDGFRYFGRGPWENYMDRFASCPVGIYESSAKDECFPYVRPQETGHHTGVEWLEIGPLCITGDKSFEFNALRCSIEDLDPREPDGGRIWAHVNDIPVQPYVELCLDGGMTGVGGYDSWGARPEPSRTLWADKDYDFTLVLSKK